MFKVPGVRSRSGSTAAEGGRAEDRAAVDPSEILSKWEEDNLASKSILCGFLEPEMDVIISISFQSLTMMSTKTRPSVLKIWTAPNPSG